MKYFLYPFLLLVLSGCVREYCIRVGGTIEHPEWENHWLCGDREETYIREVVFGDKLRKKVNGIGRVRLTFSPIFYRITPFVKNVEGEYNDGTPIK